MQHPPEVSYRGVEKTAALEDLVQKQLAKLDKVCSYIISAHVAIEKEAGRHQTGNPYRVRIYVAVPGGKEKVVKRVSVASRQFEPLPAVVRRAFDSAQRQLERLVEQQRGEVKTHPLGQTMAFVEKLFREEGYGFLRTLDGEEVYFHKNSCLHGEWERLTVGTGVRYAEEEGEKGPQASSVEIVDKPGAAEAHEKLHDLPVVARGRK